VANEFHHDCCWNTSFFHHRDCGVPEAVEAQPACIAATSTPYATLACLAMCFLFSQSCLRKQVGELI